MSAEGVDYAALEAVALEARRDMCDDMSGVRVPIALDDLDALIAAARAGEAASRRANTLRAEVKTLADRLTDDGWATPELEATIGAEAVEGMLGARDAFVTALRALLADNEDEKEKES